MVVVGGVKVTLLCGQPRTRKWSELLEPASQTLNSSERFKIIPRDLSPPSALSSSLRLPYASTHSTFKDVQPVVKRVYAKRSCQLRGRVAVLGPARLRLHRSSLLSEFEDS